MQVNLMWLIRTPYTAEQAPTFELAKQHFQSRAAEMGITPKWRKGRGSIYDKGPRYHYWEIDNEQDAHLFFLACGDQIKTQRYARNT